MGLFVGTIVTLSLYMLSNSVLSVAAVPVIPQSFGNCSSAYDENYEVKKEQISKTVSYSEQRDDLEKEVLIAD